MPRLDSTVVADSLSNGNGQATVTGPSFTPELQSGEPLIAEIIDTEAKPKPAPRRRPPIPAARQARIVEMHEVAMIPPPPFAPEKKPVTIMPVIRQAVVRLRTWLDDMFSVTRSFLENAYHHRGLRTHALAAGIGLFLGYLFFHTWVVAPAYVSPPTPPASVINVAGPSIPPSQVTVIVPPAGKGNVYGISAPVAPTLHRVAVIRTLHISSSLFHWNQSRSSIDPWFVVDDQGTTRAIPDAYLKDASKWEAGQQLSLDVSQWPVTNGAGLSVEVCKSALWNGRPGRNNEGKVVDAFAVLAKY
jgi:hypothetical protein